MGSDRGLVVCGGGFWVFGFVVCVGLGVWVVLFC